jgi:hypothetical protein
MKWNGPIVKKQGKKVINKSVYETGLIVESKAKLLCARRYGYLAASINTQSIENGTELESPGKYAKENPPAKHKTETFEKVEKPPITNETYVGTHVDYGPHVEFGTIYQDAQPFLRPALELAKGNVLEIVKINGKRHFLGYLLEHENYLRSRGL